MFLRGERRDQSSPTKLSVYDGDGRFPGRLPVYLSQFPAATGELPIVREVPAVEHPHAGRHLRLTGARIVVVLVAYGLIHDSVELSDSPPLELSEPPASIESVVTQRAGLGRLTATERDEPGLAVEI